jgi:hypothetical protein
LRKLLRNNRGQVRVIEAFFASVLLLSTLTMIPIIQTNTSRSNNVLSSTAFNALATLDNNGYLGEIVDQKNWAALQSCIETVLSPALWFNLTVYDESMTPVNTTPICSGSSISNHIEVADYLCASMNSHYSVYTLRLQIAGLN